MIYHDVIQYSPAYWELRSGVPTSSEFKRIFKPVKKAPSAGQDKYIAELIAQALAPTAPFFTERAGHTEEMRNGINVEPEARAWYAFELGLEVHNGGFVLTDDKRFGASPDGLVAGDAEATWAGCLELKCPRIDTQLRRLMKGVIPPEYLTQVHGQLIVTGLPWVDFMSYCPPAEPLLIRVTPNEYTDKLRAALDVFWKRLEAAKERFLRKAVAV